MMFYRSQEAHQINLKLIKYENLKCTTSSQSSQGVGVGGIFNMPHNQTDLEKCTHLHNETQGTMEHKHFRQKTVFVRRKKKDNNKKKQAKKKTDKELMYDMCSTLK